MTKQKKNIARLFLQGIIILGILIGGLLVIAAIGILLEIQKDKDDLVVLFGSLVLSAVFLVIGVYAIYSSYQMLRHRAFAAATKGIPSSLATSVFLAIEPVMSWTDTLASKELTRHVRLFCALVSLLFFFLAISVFTKLFKRLVEAANEQPARILGESGDSEACA